MPYQHAIMHYPYVNKNENVLNYLKISRLIAKCEIINVEWKTGKNKDRTEGIGDNELVIIENSNLVQLPEIILY
jgi:hypothetical protein